MKNLLWVILVLGFGVAAFMSGTWYIKQQQHQEVRAEVVLESIKKVWKLSTVEATISEIYAFRDYYYYDVSPLRKTALVKVNAKVLAGFDFDSITIVFDELTQTLTLSNFPEAQILSIDHDLSYYDLQQGSFNGFTPEDLTKLQARAKDSIQNDAIKSNILKEAAGSKAEMLGLLSLAAKGMGWTVVIDEPKEERIFIRD
jgi:hypothetical protein